MSALSSPVVESGARPSRVPWLTRTATVVVGLTAVLTLPVAVATLLAVLSGGGTASREASVGGDGSGLLGLVFGAAMLLFAVWLGYLSFGIHLGQRLPTIVVIVGGTGRGLLGIVQVVSGDQRNVGEIVQFLLPVGLLLICLVSRSHRRYVARCPQRPHPLAMGRLRRTR
jgi:hypothetical protein